MIYDLWTVGSSFHLFTIFNLNFLTIVLTTWLFNSFIISFSTLLNKFQRQFRYWLISMLLLQCHNLSALPPFLAVQTGASHHENYVDAYVKDHH